MADTKLITVTTLVNASPHHAWDFWTKPEHIVQWNHASADWHTKHASVELKQGGKFLSRMEAKDGSVGFDFVGTFTKIVRGELLEYVLEDNRKVSVRFAEQDGAVIVTETFETETKNPVEMQRDGWQAILNNFKKYAESLSS